MRAPVRRGARRRDRNAGTVAGAIVGGMVREAQWEGLSAGSRLEEGAEGNGSGHIPKGARKLLLRAA
jgi:uncharacterized protein YcfJ